MRPPLLRLFSVLALLGAAAFTHAGDGPRSAPDLILHNGKFFTGDPQRPEAAALAIRGDRIVAVGDDETVLALAGADSERIDLHGRRVVPGINDAHEHLGWQPSPGTRLDLPEPDPAGADVEAALSAQPTTDDEWIRGQIGSYVFTDPAWNRARLDTLQPTRPVALSVFTGHGLLLNSAAVRALRVDPAVPVPGGWYGEDANGGFDGRVFEYAGWKTTRAYPRPGDETEIGRLRAYADQATRSGVTSVQSMSWLPLPEIIDLWKRSGAPQRLRAIRFPGVASEGTRVPDLDLPRTLPGTRVEVSGTKWILDGTGVEQASPWRKPYPDGSNGRLNFSRDDMRAMLEETLARDDQLLLHVIGDAAIEATLDAMAAIAPPEDWRGKRVRFEHGDGLAPDLLSRAAAFGLIVVQNPSHFMIPPDHPAFALIRENHFSPLSDLLAAGIPLALGSDGPSNPWLNLLFATAPATRPDQALTREQALRAYTEGSAYAEFKEHEKGRLAPGYLADLAVLSQDVLDEAAVPAQDLPKTRSLLTVIGGDVVWRDPAF